MKEKSIVIYKLIISAIFITFFSNVSFSQSNIYQETYFVKSDMPVCLEEYFLKQLVISAQQRDRATYNRLMADESCSMGYEDIPFKIIGVRFQGRIVEIESPLAPGLNLFTVPDALGLPAVLENY